MQTFSVSLLASHHSIDRQPHKTDWFGQIVLSGSRGQHVIEKLLKYDILEGTCWNMEVKREIETRVVLDRGLSS